MKGGYAISKCYAILRSGLFQICFTNVQQMFYAFFWANFFDILW